MALLSALRKSSLAFFFCLVVALVPQRAAAQCEDRGTVVEEGVSNVQGKPFQAKQITTIVFYNADGSKSTKVTKANLFRDSKGRIRVERFYDGTENPLENMPTDVIIDDNCGTVFILRPSDHTVKIQKMPPSPTPSNHPVCAEVDSKNPPGAGNPKDKFEDLGHKFVDGVEIRGERWSSYSSEKAKASGAPPVEVRENWCSMALQNQVGGYILNDNPKQEIITVVSDIQQGEPDSALFEIPTGYKTIETGKPNAAP